MGFRTFTQEEAYEVANKIGLDLTEIDVEEFRKGLTVELEHGAHDEQTNVTDDDMQTTGKIAWAHLKEVPDYYTKLQKYVEPE